MQQRIPLVLASAALVVALIGSPVSAATSIVRKALFATNAGAVNGIKASRSPAPGKLLPLSAHGLLPASVMPPLIAARVELSASSPPFGLDPSDGGASNPPVVPVPFNLVRFDTGHFYDPAQPGHLTIPRDGIYLITADIGWDSLTVDPKTAGSNRALELTTGTGTLAREQGPPATDTWQTMTTIAQLSAGDTLTVWPGHDNPTPTDITARDDAPSAIEIVYLGPSS